MRAYQEMLFGKGKTNTATKERLKKELLNYYDTRHYGNGHHLASLENAFWNEINCKLSAYYSIKGSKLLKNQPNLLIDKIALFFLFFSAICFMCSLRFTIIGL